jgi:hypothetical protein
MDEPTATLTINGLTIGRHAVVHAEAVVRYGQHKPSCGGTAGTCSCGFQRAYEQARGLLVALEQVTK